jgi:hypothetical protein
MIVAVEGRGDGSQEWNDPKASERDPDGSAAIPKLLDGSGPG